MVPYLFWSPEDLELNQTAAHSPPMVHQTASLTPVVSPSVSIPRTNHFLQCVI